MESSDLVIDSIKLAFSSALARYRRFTNVTKLIQAMEVFVAVAVISWSSSHLPSVFRFSGEYVTVLSSYKMNQHVVFLVGNVIVVVCYVLSRYYDSGSDSGDVGVRYDDGRSNLLTHQERNYFDSNAVMKPTASQVIGVTASSPDPESQTPMNLNPVIVTEKSIIKSESEFAGDESAIKQATTKQIERFQRSKSEKVKSEMTKPHRSLRRSVTEKRRSTAVASGGDESTVRSFPEMEKLSDEEFRIEIESFISKQQRFMKQQSIVEE